jgi:hypothetical protein
MEPILYEKDPHLEVCVAEPHHFDAALPTGENIDAAATPAPPAPTLLYCIPSQLF